MALHIIRWQGTKKTLFATFFFVIFLHSSGAFLLDTTTTHEITVYIFAPAAPINWQSPSSLYQSVRKSYLRYYLHKQKRFLGHLAFDLKSTLLEKPVFMSIAASDKKVFFQQLFKKKIGLGVLGYPFQGVLEPADYTQRSLTYHAKKGQLAFIRFQVNEDAARRVLEFIKVFSLKVPGQKSPSDYYGGVFWPLYEGEGAGCSALTIAALEVAGLSLPEKENWKVAVKIPLPLIGGLPGASRKIKLKTIRKTKNWYQGNGVEDMDYVNFEIYDPLLVWQWVQQKRLVGGEGYEVVNKEGVPGLNFDYRAVRLPRGQPIFTPRARENFFLKHYSKTPPAYPHGKLSADE